MDDKEREEKIKAAKESFYSRVNDIKDEEDVKKTVSEGDDKFKKLSDNP